KGAPGSQEGQGPQLESVALHALLLCEGLFDPYETWRRQHRKVSQEEPVDQRVAISGSLLDPRLVPLALEALVGAVHVLHASRTPPRGPELRTLLEGYFRILNADWPAGPSPGPEEALVTLRVSMLDAIPRMLVCEDRPVLQATFLSNNCFEHLTRLIQNSKVGGAQVSMGCGLALGPTCMFPSSPHNPAQEVFKERIGFPHLHEVLQSHGPPTHRLLQELLNMAVEGDHSICPPPPILNEQPVLMLMQWLPALPTAELRLFLAQRLRWLCDSCPASRATCVQAGLVGHLLETLGAGAALGAHCQEQLLALLQALGRVSLRPLELRCLLRPPAGLDSGPAGAEAGNARHAGAVIRALSGMARHQGGARALHYFDLTPGMAGIMVPPVQRWPGPGFTFHAWLCLSGLTGSPGPRSFFTSSGSGFEAFFTAAGTLVVAVCTRKEYLTMSLPEVSFADSAWHCVAIVHVPGRRPFSQNLVHVYKDGQLVQTAPLRCPSLSEPFSSCCIGSAGHRTTTTTTGPPTPPVPAALAHAHPSFSRSQSVPATAGLGWGSGLVAPLQEGTISSTLAGTQDTRWGSPTSLEGELGTIVIFHEVLPPAALRALFTLGEHPHPLGPAPACRNNICLDLSPGHGLDGRLTGHRVETWDVKDVVTCVGGMAALLPLLERVASQPQEAEAGPAETHDLVGPELTSGHNTQEVRMERNAVAAFLLMLRNFLQGHAVNQESLVQCQGPAIIGALLRKVPSWAMDMNVLMSAQLLMEQVAAEGSGPLLYLLYQHLLFNFHLWSPSDFAVRLGHIQYMSSIVREHRQKLRKKYGVQFILDALRTHYSPQREHPLAADDVHTVQTSLLGLVRELLVRRVGCGYAEGSSQPRMRLCPQVVGALDLLLALLQGSPAQESLAIFLLEQGNLEVLLALLVQPRSLPLLPDRVCKVQPACADPSIPSAGSAVPSLPHPSHTSHLCPQQTSEEELCNLLTNVLFSVTWRGVEGSDEAAWRERGQVFSVLTQLGASATLVRPPDCIKRSLLEMMLESALTDIKEAPVGVLASLTQQALWLLRLLQDFLCAEGHGNQELWSEKLFEGVCSLLDRLGAWPHLANGTADLREMAQIGLRLVLGYILLEDPQLHAQAYVKLHSLLQTTVPMRREEACYVLSKLEAALSPSAAAAATERCSWLVPLVRTLLDRAYGPLGLQWGLPSLPPTNGSPTFFEDFQAFCATPEWRHFIDKQVQPTMSQFEMDTYAKSHDLMSGFWNACYDTLMSSGQRRQRERTQGRRAFQELVLEPAQRRVRLEGLRYGAAVKQQAAQQSTALLHWGALWRQLSSPCGAWALRWGLGGAAAETYSRMRLKLVPNHHFNPHLEASALRDNLGEGPLTPTEEASLPLAVTKEAKVSTLPEELQEDQLSEEELAAVELDEQHEKLVLSAECQLVTVVAVIPGLLEITTQHVYFYDGSAERVETEEGIGHDFRRPLTQLREVHLRRFNLRRSALELFFIDQANYFLNFPCKVRNQMYSLLLRLRPPAQGYLSSRSPQEMLRASGLTQKWVQREISNFEYLMQLNTIAGRTYNDLSQYPVFPWVLQDYVSPTLDLSNPAVFRDLSKPIGVVNPKHAQLVREKYESFEDPAGTIDKFHYGTHYSNAAGVMHYLIRVEPFTSLHVQLQSGRFDCSDRQFHSVAAAWQARLESPADVKELIPEFFYFPDFLENQNGFDLGCLQLTNEKVGDVVLPPWASSPEDFIQQHRQALESEYVSAHLHEWIDLIFGYKQRGPAAEEALNVFYYCTYEGAVDLDHVVDERERKALEGIISNFGQTPCQLLKEPHPARLSAEEAAQRLARLDTNSPSIFQHLDQLKAFFAEVISEGVPLVLAVVPHRQSHSFTIQGSSDLLVTVSASGLLGIHNWLPYDRNINNYFSFNKDPTIGNPKMQRLLSGPWVPESGVSGQALAVAPDAKLLFSGGHWDGSLRVTALPRGKLLKQLNRHLDVVTCLALDTCGIYLISGSRDTTCMVWRLLQEGGLSVGLASKPVQVLYGHEAAVSCVAINTELDMAVSGSEDGTVIIHTVRRGQFVAALRPPGATLPGPVFHLALGSEGHIVVQSSARERVTYSLHLYSVNGKLRASLPLVEQQSCPAAESSGLPPCRLLPAAPPLPMKVPIRSVAVTKERSHVLVGLEDGKLIVVGAGQPSEARSSQFARKLWRSSRRISQVSSGETEYNPGEAR
uniref:Neurobeachin-like protein 2 n=1 Tax=Canis lupus dingo TaxID=286419 RepID=A0A8C0KM69_CANLU